MKKRMLATALIATMVLSMTACSGDASGSNETKDSSVSTENSVSTEESKDDDKEAEASENLTSETVEAPEGLNDYYVEEHFGYSVYLPKAYNQTEGYGYASYVPKINYEGQTDISDCEIIYVTQYSGEVGDDKQKEQIDMSQYEDSTDIFDLLIGNIEHELFGGVGLLVENYSVEITETTEINGIEMTKFEGEINMVDNLVDEWKYTYPIAAYGIKAEGTPVLICAIDRTKEQSEHEYWAEKIDEIVETFRNGAE